MIVRACPVPSLFLRAFCVVYSMFANGHQRVQVAALLRSRAGCFNSGPRFRMANLCRSFMASKVTTFSTIGVRRESLQTTSTVFIVRYRIPSALTSSIFYYAKGLEFPRFLPAIAFGFIRAHRNSRACTYLDGILESEFVTCYS